MTDEEKDASLKRYRESNRRMAGAAGADAFEAYHAERRDRAQALEVDALFDTVRQDTQKALPTWRDSHHPIPAAGR